MILRWIGARLDPVIRRAQLMRLRGTLVWTFGIWLMLRQVDSVLGRLQTDVAGSYGANDFWQPGFQRVANHVTDLVHVWNGNKDVARLAYGTYTALDVVFIAAYSALLLVILARLGTPAPREDRPLVLGRLATRTQWLVVALAAADLLEDALRTFLVYQDPPADWLSYVAWGVTWLKWVLLGCVLILIAQALHWHVRTAPSRGLLRAALRLRVPVVLLGAWGVFVLFDPTGQTADIFRRWLNDALQFGESALFSIGATAALAFATWTTSRRAVLAHFDVTADDWLWLKWLTVGAAVAVLALATGSENLWGIVVVIGAVFALTGLALVLRHYFTAAEQARHVKDDEDAESRLEDRAEGPSDSEEVRRVARGLATWPLVALMLGAASAWTAPPVVLLALGEDTGRAWLSALAALAFLGLAVAATYHVPRVLLAWEKDNEAPQRDSSRLLGERWPSRLEYRHVLVAAGCLAVAALAIKFPFGVPQKIGALAVTAIFVSLVIIGLGETQRYGDTHSPPLGLRAIGFSSFPLSLLLLTAYATSSAIWNDGSYHAVHRTPAVTAPDPTGVDLETAFADWTHRSCVDAGQPTDDVPMVFIASHGGGIRAAYWTAGVLAYLVGGEDTTQVGTCRARPIDRVFAMGGASGGSVGVTSFLGHTTERVSVRAKDAWYRRTLGEPDYAAVPVSWGLLVDAPRTLIGFDSPDRARRFEESLERRDAELKRDFFAGQGTTGPLLMLASTQVESGCRVNVSAIRLTSQQEKGRCAAIETRKSVTYTPDGTVVPDAPLTAELLDYLCTRGSLERASAALASARFPYVSPSGQFRCGEDDFTSVVDGGYAENTGAQGVLNLWYRVRTLVAAHNRSNVGARIIPVFINIDNHYSKAAKAGPPSRTQELFVPPATAGRPGKLGDVGVEQLVEAEFSRPVPGQPQRLCSVGGPGGGGLDMSERYARIAPTRSPGIPAPLAWTLSEMAQNDLDKQREQAFDPNWARALAEVVRDGLIACTY